MSTQLLPGPWTRLAIAAAQTTSTPRMTARLVMPSARPASTRLVTLVTVETGGPRGYRLRPTREPAEIPTSDRHRAAFRC
jgi:hypothetical protein